MLNIVKNYFRVLEVISSLNFKLDNKSYVGRKQKMSDLEVVALSLTTEFMSIDSKNSLFKEINSEQISNLIERSQFNKRRRKLFLFLEEVRTKLASRFLENSKIILSWIVCLWRFANLLVIGELKSLKTSLKLLLQRGFVLLKTTGFTDINCTEFVL
jgi:hypothetical protein